MLSSIVEFEASSLVRSPGVHCPGEAGHWPGSSSLQIKSRLAGLLWGREDPEVSKEPVVGRGDVRNRV